MSTPNDGGPAFPSDSACDSWQCRKPSSGMSLRDWFAAHASEEDILEHMPDTQEEARAFKEAEGFWPNRQWARYQHADAMLKARGAK